MQMYSICKLVRSTDHRLDQQIENLINRSHIGSKDQKVDQQIKSQINRSKVGSTDKELDQQIKSYRYDVDVTQMQFRSES